jgi:hypothetical protein
LRGHKPSTPDAVRELMTALFRDPWYTFHVADDQIIPGFHLGGIPG